MRTGNTIETMGTDMVNAAMRLVADFMKKEQKTTAAHVDAAMAGVKGATGAAVDQLLNATSENRNNPDKGIFVAIFNTAVLDLALGGINAVKAV